MIPYIEAPVFDFGLFTISGFKILVAMAVLSGYAVAIHRLKKSGLPFQLAANFLIWVALSAFIFSHLFALLAYHPEKVWHDPLLLFNIFNEMSSFGGMAGGIIGGMLFLQYHRRLSFDFFLRLYDVIAYAFTFGWIFGRAGCSIVHDHPGIASTHWLAVRFPDGPRLDLGLLELFLTIFIAATFFLLGKRSRPPGFFIAMFIILYAPVRFIMDSLRISDVRYWGWTPGQFVAALMTVLGIVLMFYVLRSRSDDGARS